MINPRKSIIYNIIANLLTHGEGDIWMSMEFSERISLSYLYLLYTL